MSVSLPVHVNGGDVRCKNHLGILRIVSKTCCGGSRVKQRAVIQCSVRGEVTVGQHACDYICRNYERIV